MIIGLVGFAGSGKGTVADSLVRHHQYYKFAFADALKDAVASIFVWPRQLLEGDTNASRSFREKPDVWWSSKFGYEVTPRLMLQRVGTEAFRNNIHDDIWIHTLFRRIQGYTDVVISDVRFPNEIKFIKENGGIIVRVKRGDEPVWWDDALIENTQRQIKLSPMTKKYPDVHPSEWKWIGTQADYIIENNGTVDDLKKNVATMLTTLEKQSKSETPNL